MYAIMFMPLSETDIITMEFRLYFTFKIAV